VAFRFAASIYLLSIAAPADTRARFLELGYNQAFQQYSGRAMRESHEQLKITEAEWAAFCKDFDDTMAKFGVPDAEKNELFAIVQSTKGDIVIG
jgi:truncated hemoglobin YjbI